MDVVARIVGVALLTAALGAAIGYVLFVFGDTADWRGLGFALACLGAIVGAVAGAAGEIVTAQRRLGASKAMSRTRETWE